MSIIGLPDELLLMAIELIPRRQDVLSLCAVSKDFNRLANLYILHKSNALKLYNVETLKFQPLLANEECAFEKIVSFEVTSLYHNEISFWTAETFSNRCGPISDEKLDLNIWRTLQRFKKNHLKKFTWNNIGTPVLWEILGSDGHLANEQSTIESLELVTSNIFYQGSIYKIEHQGSQFKSLKELSWKGYRSTRDIVSLGYMLNNAAPQLRKLVLEPMGWSLDQRPDTEWTDDLMRRFHFNRLDRHTLLLIRCPVGGGLQLQFPNLNVLSLSNMELARPGPGWCQRSRDFVSSLNIECLCTLKVRRCHGWENLLIAVIEAKQSIQLKTLEIQWDYQQTVQGQPSLRFYLLTFLEKFEGLEELFLSISDDIVWTEDWKFTEHHKSTLRSYVFHQRMRLSDRYDKSNPLWTDEECDLVNMRGGYTRFNWRIGKWEDKLIGHDLEFFGLCCDVELLKMRVHPFTKSTSLKVLHLRQSGRDLRVLPSIGAKGAGTLTDLTPVDDPSFDPYELTPEAMREGSGDQDFDKNGHPRPVKAFHEFANWAFGPNGIPSLQILAYGDFSFDGRYNGKNLLLCRHQTDRIDAAKANRDDYRHMERKDWVLWNLLEKHANALSACPVDPLMENVGKFQA
ncbi:hypothetical protein BT63DRAFT_479411 [Microthyrium microscopicum]|uniref:F-box domain-containing protein n=1 Tax=Microthyrium microscopicum TaxID=703497 RepID=A0A6A6UEV3_9PEZI|nr:hypothetical protein BT63DRAFT_479411 [Microthyrium microscopicum]